MFTISRCSRIRAQLELPGDKSISHRAAMLGALSEGNTVIYNFAPGRDCAATLDCLRGLGIRVETGDTHVAISGVGLHGLREPVDVLNCSNSGTTMRLLAGILAGQDFMSVLTGDSSLRSRPMRRIVEPLRRMGASVDGREKGLKAPLYIRGPGPAVSNPLTPLEEYHLPVASAQVKSCVLLAGLYADGTTTVVERLPSRDHTERILSLFGAQVSVENARISVTGFPRLRANVLRIPGDISSAAFWLAAGAIVPDSEVEVKRVGLNPTRCGFLRTLQKMGCRLDMTNRHDDWEPVGDVRVTHGTLRAVEIGPEEVPLLVDELPILAVCAALARGKTVVRGAGELRHKESDRISAIVENLRAMGASAGELADGFWVEGGARLRGTLIRTRGDHRIAMAFAVAGLVAEGETRLDDADCVDVSYPGFLHALKQSTT